VSNTAQYTIGAKVTCSDGDCGNLSRVVINPVARTLTHLVVEPKHQQGLGRLVPIDLVDATGEEIRLRCSAAEFDALEHAEETHFLPEAGEDMGYGAGQAFAWPYYGLGGGMGAMGMGGMEMAAPVVIVDDRVPAGEVEVRRGEHVHATDGSVGRVRGLVIDPKDHHVTHVLLEQGHLWGKREITIPIGAVKDVAAEGVRLNLTRDEVRDLPPVDLAHHG
jgi:sporulation protein YlmC with PRC-barrel domain